MSAWILLRGLTRESRHWGAFPQMLHDACPAMATHTLDLPGNGRLNEQASPTHVEAMAEHCRMQLREQGIAPPYFLLAMSLGAMVAVAWMSRHPEEIGGGVLINTSLRPFSPFHHRLRPHNYLPLARLLLHGGTVEERERTILRLTSCNAERPETLAAWAAHARQNPVSSRNALRQLLAAARYRAPAAKPAPPMLILASTQDRLVNPRCSRRLARCWKTDFAEHPGAGHDLPLDDGPWVAEQVSLWLQDLARRPPFAIADDACRPKP